MDRGTVALAMYIETSAVLYIYVVLRTYSLCVEFAGICQDGHDYSQASARSDSLSCRERDGGIQ